LTVCQNETAIELDSRRIENVNSVTANEFAHWRRPCGNARKRTYLRAPPLWTCSTKAVSCGLEIKQEIGHWWPAVLPDGRVLFTIIRASTGLNDARIALLDPANGSYRVLFPGAKATWLPSGHVVFYRTGRYHAVPFDVPSGTVTGEPFPVLDDALPIAIATPHSLRFDGSSR
jgi:hypothetical protein